MKKRESTNNVTVNLTGVETKTQAGRMAGKTKTRSGEKRRGKFESEIIRGEEFNVLGELMKKVRIIDRKNDLYKEKITNIVTGEVVRDVEEPLKSHTGRGSDNQNRKS